MNFIRLTLIFFISILLFLVSSCTSNDTIISPIKNLNLVSIYNLEIPEPSGLSFGKNMETLWTISDAPDNKIYQIDLKGNILKVLNIKGDDFEGVAYDSLKDVLLVTEEKKYSIVEVTLSGEKIATTKIPFNGNDINGFEGICLSDSNIYIANEKLPLKILKLALDYSIVDSYGLMDLNDVSGLFYDKIEKRIWGVSDENKLLFSFDELSGEIEYYQLPYDKMEGLAIDLVNNRIYIVNDSRQKLYVFEIAK